MNLQQIKKYRPVFEGDDGESYFLCLLSNNRIMEISFWSFYEFIIMKDKNLKIYADKFFEWEALTKDLHTLEFDFIFRLNDYLQQFNESQIFEFSKTKEEIDYIG